MTAHTVECPRCKGAGETDPAPSLNEQCKTCGGACYIRVHTTHEYPPIPTRSLDWSAVDDNYDADCDEDGFHTTCPIGRGATEEEAIANLLTLIEERDA